MMMMMMMSDYDNDAMIDLPIEFFLMLWHYQVID